MFGLVRRENAGANGFETSVAGPNRRCFELRDALSVGSRLSQFPESATPLPLARPCNDQGLR